MTAYRQRPGRDVWHFHSRCRWWPTIEESDAVQVRYDRPTTGELCNECQAKTKRDAG